MLQKVDIKKVKQPRTCGPAVSRSARTKVLSVCIWVMEMLTRDSFWGPAGATDTSEDMGRGGGGWVGRRRGRGWL